jgi:hypothetical protein
MNFGPMHVRQKEAPRVFMLTGNDVNSLICGLLTCRSLKMANKFMRFICGLSQAVHSYPFVGAEAVLL